MCVYQGLPFFLEVKRPGGKVSTRQAIEVSSWLAVGAASGVVYSIEDALGIIMAAKAERTLTIKP
jgi:hypothetical protein